MLPAHSGGDLSIVVLMIPSLFIKTIAYNWLHLSRFCYFKPKFCSIASCIFLITIELATMNEGMDWCPTQPDDRIENSTKDNSNHPLLETPPFLAVPDSATLSGGLESVEYLIASELDDEDPCTPLEDNLSLVRFGVSQSIGGREEQDDSYSLFSVQLESGSRYTVAAVLDGHHGNRISDMVAASLPRIFISSLEIHSSNMKGALLKTCHQLDEMAYLSHVAGIDGGTTLLIHVLASNELWTASIGDCKGVLSSRGAPEALNVCHNPPEPSERARFEAAGLRIFGDHIEGSSINVCRTIGDYDLGKPLKWRNEEKHRAEGPISAEPDISMRRIERMDEFIVAASDGLWDYYGLDSTVVTETRRALRRLDNDPQQCADWLVREALTRQLILLHESTPGDNVTVLVMSLRPVPDLPKSQGSRLNLRAST